MFYLDLALCVNRLMFLQLAYILSASFSDLQKMMCFCLDQLIKCASFNVKNDRMQPLKTNMIKKDAQLNYKGLLTHHFR